MKSSAIVHIIGNLGADAVLKTVGGTSLSSFSIAVSTKTSKGDTTTWYRIDCWGKLGETLNQYLTKGKSVYVVGNLTQEDFTDRDGNKRSVLQVKANEITLLDRRESTSSEPAVPVANNAIRGEDDTPF